MVYNYEYRYERKPGRYIYIQTAASSKEGRAIIKRVGRLYKPHPIFFHLRRRGGHVAAMRVHAGSEYLTRFDIDNFFGNVTRTKISRALRDISISYRAAFNIAHASVVVEGSRRCLPFGFCQSPILATLVLERSVLGRELKRLATAGFHVSVYMDDIVLSSNDERPLGKKAAS